MSSEKKTEDEFDKDDEDEVKNDAPNQFNQKEKDDMIVFLVNNFKDYGITHLWRKYAEVRDTGMKSKTCDTRFRKHLAPRIHLIDCSVETKLEIYQKYGIKVNKKYVGELKKHANVTFKHGVVVEFKMKDEREEREGLDDNDSIHFEPMEMDSGDAGDIRALADVAPKVEKQIVRNDEQRDDYDSDLDLPMQQNQKDHPDGVEEHVDDVSMDIGNPKLKTEVTGREDLPDGWNQKEMDEMWKFLVENFREYKVTNLWKQYSKDTKIPYLKCIISYYKGLVPYVHLFDCPFETKLELCQKYNININGADIKEVKKRAKSKKGQTPGPSTRPTRRRTRRTLDGSGWIDDFEKNDGAVEGQIAGPSTPPKRKRGRPPKARPEKKPKRGREVGDEEDDEPADHAEHLIEAHPIVAEQIIDEEDDELIVDAVKPGTGISNPDMIIVVPKEEELVEDGGYFTPDQGHFYQGDYGMEDRLMAEMRSMKKEMMDKMNKNMQKNMKNMTASGDKKADELKNEMKTMVNNLQGFMKKEIDSLKKDNKTLVKTVASLQQMTSTRPHESGDVDAVPNKKECLLKLKDFVHSLNSPEIEEIKQQIDKVIQDLEEDDEDPMPTRQIAEAIDSILRSMNQ